jgi:UDP-N-acetylmuramate dehydrogenase
MLIEENKEVTNNSTFRIKTIAQYYCEVENLEDLKFALNFVKEKKVNWCILGDGSNTIFANENLNYLIIKNKILGIEKLDFEIYKVGAGENWDNFVRFISKQNLYGIEMLAYIPGTIGAAPVQNIAAYGGQVSDTILEIEVYNIQTEKVEILKNEECNFVYRGSRFKKEKYFIILNVTFKFSKKPLKNIYKEIEIYLTTNGKQKNLAGQFFKIEGEEKQEEIKFTANQITEAVTNIRKTKLPEVEETSNVGSFFQNPIIEKEKLAKILEKFPNVIFHEVDKEKVKLGAGRLSEILGFKGFVFKNFGVHKDHAIILIHLGNGKADDLFELIKIIQNKVKENFDIDFEIEPNFLIN